MNGAALASERKGRDMVFSIFCEDGEVYSYDYKALDGDIRKVKPIDMTFDRGKTKLPGPSMQGLKMDVTHLPTKLRWGGPKRELTDLQHGGVAFLVPEAFKEILERLEPGVHDFYPVELIWKDGTSAGKRYWFYPQHRLDTVDREKTTHTIGKGLWDLDSNKSGKLVFSHKAIGDRHAWIDKLIPGGSIVFVSEAFKRELEAAGITGLGFRPYEETD